MPEIMLLPPGLRDKLLEGEGHNDQAGVPELGKGNTPHPIGNP